MGSYLDAFVCTAPELLRMRTADLGVRVVEIGQELGLLPCPNEVRRALADEHGAGGNAIWEFDGAIARLAKEWSVGCQLAYVQAETFGGDGMQSAAVWADAALIWGPRRTCDLDADAVDGYTWTTDPSQSAVNCALRELGVARDGAVDEYAAVGLDRHRRTEDWLQA